MRIIKFNEQLEKETKFKSESINYAKKCIKKCKECKTSCEKSGHSESVNACNECIKCCELYILSHNNDSSNFENIAELTIKIASDCADICSKHGAGICVDSCIELSEYIDEFVID